MLRLAALADPANTSVLTNCTGDFHFLNQAEVDALNSGGIDPQSKLGMDLRAKGLWPTDSNKALKGLEAAVLRTRKAFLEEGPALHIFVVTLRCDHSCQYCQVSRAAVDADGFDMTLADAQAALETVFQSPSPHLTIEFQGGEPALRMDLVRQIVELAELMNLQAQRTLRFSMVSTLHHLSEDDLQFCKDHEVHLSTSIDGPADLHDRQRPNPGRNAHALTLHGLERARAVLGHDGVAALPTLTRASLSDPVTLIDSYRELGFASIFLRPVSPYGFARKTGKALGVDMPSFLAFYEAALDHILALNAAGEAFEETFAAVLLRHILTPFHSGYTDLRSPAAAGLGTLVYNYDGLVYPSDEARMAARTGDGRFALGPVGERLEVLLGSPAMNWLRRGVVAEELPGCRDCAFVPYCGADPVHHAIVQGEPWADRIESDFCAKHLGVFRLLFARLAEGDAETLRTFEAWAFRRPRRAHGPAPIL